MLTDDSRYSVGEKNFTIPFDPAEPPNLHLLPTGDILNDVASHIFMVYYRLTHVAFLALCNVYLQAGKSHTQCFGDPPTDVCLRITIGELKVRLGLIGWVGLMMLDYHIHLTSAYSDRWSTLGENVKTQHGFRLAKTFPYRNVYEPNKLEYSGSLEEPPVCNSDMSYNSTLGAVPHGTHIDTNVQYSGLEVEQKSILYTTFLISRGLIWAQEPREPIALDIDTSWLVSSPPEDDMLKMTLLADKDYQNQPLSWGWLAVGLDSLLDDLATTRIWDAFEATTSFKETGVAFMKIEVIKNAGSTKGIAASDIDKITADKVEIRRFEPGGKLVETIPISPLNGSSPDTYVQMPASDGVVQNVPQTS